LKEIRVFAKICNSIFENTKYGTMKDKNNKELQTEYKENPEIMEESDVTEDAGAEKSEKGTAQQIYRQSSLKRMNEQEQLNKPLKLNGLHLWLIIVALVLFIVGAICYYTIGP